MGKYRRRRVVWVPRGYRLKSRYRKANKTQLVAATVQEESVISSPEASENTPPVSQANQDSPSPKEPLMQETAEVTSTANTESKLAEFDASFNPYQSYVQDLARCLTSMPKSVFTASSEEGAEVSNDANHEKEPVDHLKKPSEPVRPKSGSERRRLEPNALPQNDSKPKAKTQTTKINWSQPSSYQGHSSYAYQFKFVANGASDHKQESAIPEEDKHSFQHAENKRQTVESSAHSKPQSASRQPNLRWLTGVRSCMRATDRQ